ncbi:MAG: TraB/GumN family protein [Phaeodactylibacter sp.]|nr:TraB/GumN family protein [Phaeodactylibacter sp.]
MRPKQKTLLWEFETEGGVGPSFLFGTMHVQDQRAFTFLELAKEKILDCSLFALEFDLADAPLAMDASMLQLPNNKTLDQLLSRPVFEKLRRIFLKTVQLDIATFRHFSPMLVANLINERLLSRDMPVSLDEHLWQFARQTGVPTTGIETYAEQMEVLQHISLDYQLKSLVSMGRHFRRHRQQLLHMAKLYESAEIFKLYQAAKRSASGLRGLLLFRRNQIMANRIGQMAREQRLFCAIGAGHLAGGKGVIRLLKQEGFRMRPVAWRGNE